MLKNVHDNHSQERQSSVFFSPLSEGEVSVTGDNQKQRADGYTSYLPVRCAGMFHDRGQCVFTLRVSHQIQDSIRHDDSYREPFRSPITQTAPHTHTHIKVHVEYKSYKAQRVIYERM